MPPMTTRFSNSRDIHADFPARQISGNGRFRRLFVGGAMAITLTTLSGCSAVPDAINPAEWYNNTVDFFSGEDGQGQVANQKNPGEGQPFPSLSTVPKPSATTANQGLVPDVEGRKYAESVARQGQPAQTAMAKVAPSAAPAQPAPPAVPTVSVTPVPVPAAVPEQVVAAPSPVPAPAQVMPTEVADLPANAMLPLNSDPYATVIVSSDGIEMNGTTVPLSEKPVLPTQADAMPTLRRYPPVAGGAKIATILFDNGSDSLDRQDRMILGEVVLLHKERGGMVRIVGHSSSRTRDMDPVRHAMVNYKLSANRANKIAAALVRQGMPAEVLLVVSRSDTMPVYSESMPTGEAGNRRAEVYFVN